MHERPSIEALIERHCATLRTNTNVIGQFIAAMDAPGPDGAEAARQALALTHQVAGGGGSIGFRAVSVAAKALEHQLKQRVRQPDSTTRAETRTRFEALRQTVAAITPQSSSLYGVDFTRPAAPARRLPR